MKRLGPFVKLMSKNSISGYSILAARKRKSTYVKSLCQGGRGLGGGGGIYLPLGM